MLDSAILARFRMLWLNRCAVPTPSHETIAVKAIYLAVLLAFDQLLGYYTP